MRFRGVAVAVAIVIAVSLTGQIATAQTKASSAKRETGYAAKKPIFGAACKTCPWGAMAEVVKKAMQPYGWDIQICYVCAGGPREARMVAGAMMTEPRPNQPPPPKVPIDFGATGAQFLWWAYEGTHPFAKDPEGPRKQLRLIANIQEPTDMIVAVKSDSGITNLADIREKRLPVRMLATTGIGGGEVADILSHYGLTAEALKAQGGNLETRDNPEQRQKLDVVIGYGSLDNAPEHNIWYDFTARNNLRYLELPRDLREQIIKKYDLEERKIPDGLFRGVDEPVTAIARNGIVVYGRTDMPDDFAYTLAKAMDEHQDLLQFSQMRFSYNYRTVWKAYGVPLHPGAARYYREKGWMK